MVAGSRSSLENNPVNALAVPMNIFVQGRVDASFKWQEHVEPVSFNDLAFLPNRADPSVYCGIFNDAPIVLCQAIDDFLCLCADEATYHAIVKVFEKHWKVHSLGLQSPPSSVCILCSLVTVSLSIRPIRPKILSPLSLAPPPGTNNLPQILVPHPYTLVPPILSLLLLPSPLG